MGLENRKFNVNFAVMDCCNCGMIFAVPKALDTRWIAEGESTTFYCPMGHPQSYVGKSDKQRAKEAEAALRREKQRREWAEHNASQARKDADRAEHRRRGEKAAKTRIKNRIANGVCPCCTRSFKDLPRHMQNKHPDYVASD